MPDEKNSKAIDDLMVWLSIMGGETEERDVGRLKTPPVKSFLKEER